MRGNNNIEGLYRVTKICSCIEFFAFFSFSLLLFFTLCITNGSKNFSHFFSSSSPWAWTPSSSSSSFFSVFSFTGPPPPPPPPPPPLLLPVNPRMAMYPTFSNVKMQKAVAKMVEELNEKTISRRGMGRDPIDKKMERIEAGLGKARASIKDAILRSRYSPPLEQDTDYVPRGDIYRNAYVFQRSYMLMEKMFKIYVYEEGEAPLFHLGPSKDIYSTEGIFLGLIESNRQFRTYDADEAHVYFLPFSVVMILQHLFDPITRDKGVLERVVGDYVHVISTKYPYWNRSLGADHFMLSCHDWGPYSTKSVPKLFSNSIRVLCNANTSEGFNPLKDASLPEINLNTGDMSGLLGGSSPSQRPVLAFFAGRLHGHIRRILLKQWKGKDDDVQVYDELPKNVSYESMLRNSKYCLCPSGYEVASPRVVEAIYAECVPVLISDGYVPPLSDVLDWEEFSVAVAVEDIPNVKKILMGIPKEKYLRMHDRLRQVQRHFVMNGPPKRFDLFHMIVHSIWLRRLNVRILRN
ncbi:putative glycosyltransferase [Sesamum alatum]|uniref:Glycosyltransferase n=1 Tax=Sesamum alatum TaxID=300844 RepID=A0AAE1YFR1_9LAMI|nr:putative glycosyltransferase [Sesamum alatum]